LVVQNNTIGTRRKFNFPLATLVLRVGFTGKRQLDRAQSETVRNRLHNVFSVIGWRGAHAPSRADSGALAGGMRVPPRQIASRSIAAWPIRSWSARAPSRTRGGSKRRAAGLQWVSDSVVSAENFSSS
jgi:hypothetical protein